MYTIKMNNDKTLTQTVRETILQRENMVDKLCFIIPLTYQGVSLQDANVVVKYVLPNTNVRIEKLIADEDIYKENYLRYTMPVNTEITSLAGDVELDLSITQVDADTLTQYVLHTFPTVITVQPLKDLYNLDTSSLNFLDSMMIKLDSKIKALDMMAETYNQKVPYDLATDDENKLHLVNLKGTIGNGVKVVLDTSEDSDDSEDGTPDTPTTIEL